MFYCNLFLLVICKAFSLICSVIFVQVVQRFQELFAQTKYKEAAELAAESPQGLLRTPDTVAKFQVCSKYFFQIFSSSHTL